MNHMFDVDFAAMYGINAAILFQGFYWWCEHNRANDKNFHDGYYWTFNSIKALQIMFPYMGQKQIVSAIDKLVQNGLIVKGNYNKSPYDRTTWYAITKKGYSILLKGKMKETEMENGNAESGKPIPVIYPYISTVEEADIEDAAAAENPFGEVDDSRPDFNTVEVYAANQLGLTPGNMQEFAKYKAELSDDLIRHAIDEAGASRARTWKYVRSILNRYIADGIKTVDQAIAQEEAREDKKVKPKPQKSSYAQESEDFWSRIPRYD